jgi:O-antigen/teichoic acid export membrane protein
LSFELHFEIGIHVETTKSTLEKTGYLGKIGTDFLKYWPTMILPAIMAFVTVPIYTHTFTAADYGYYILVNSAIMLASTIGVSWIETAVLRFFAEYKRRAALDVLITTVGATLVLSLLIVVIFAKSVLSVLPLESETLSDLLDAGLWVLVTTGCLRALLTVLRAGVRATEYAILQSINIVGAVLLGLFFAIGLRVGIVGLMYGTGLMALMLVPIVMLRLPVLPYVKLGRMSKALLKELAIYGFPMAPTLLGNWVLSLSDRYILEHFRTPAEVGWYSVSYALSEKILLLPFSALMFSAMPILIAGWERGDRPQVIDGLKDLTRWYLLVACPILVGISVLAEDLVGLLVADEFIQGYLIVPYVAMGIFLWGLAQYVTRTFVLLKKSSTFMLIVLLSSAINIVANLLLVPRWGFIGAGISTVVGYGFMLILALVLERSYRLYRFPVGAFRRIGLSALLMGLVIGLLNRWNQISVFLLVPLGAGLYFAGLMLVRELRKSDLKRLWRLIKTQEVSEDRPAA